MSTPTLAAQDIHIRPLFHATNAQLHWLMDPETVKYSEQRHKNHTLASCQGYVRAFDRINNHIWTLREVDTNLQVGNITAHIDPINKVAEMGILIDRGHWGLGYGTQAWQTVSDWLLPQVRKIEAGTMACNKGMIRIFERTGMKYEGERKLHFLLDGSPVGLVYYARFK